MKYIIILILLLALSPQTARAQKIEINKVDDFTGSVIIRTSWEKLAQSMSGTMHLRVSKIDSYYSVDVKLMLGAGSIFSISEDSDLMFKLQDGQVITVKALEYAITGRGEGAVGFIGSQAMGIRATYNIRLKDIQTLAVFPVLKMRVYTNDGYVDFDLSEKRSMLLGKTFALLAK